MSNQKIPQDVINRIRELGIGPELDFYFLPSSELLNRIARGGDPILDQLPAMAKTLFLGIPPDKGIALYNPMVLKYLEGTLDQKNSYVFDMGEIRILNYDTVVIKCLNRSKICKS